jgi:hypothetical protein
VEECPIRFHDEPVLPRCGGDLTQGLTPATRPFLQSVVNFQAAFIASTLNKTSLDLRGMTILETFQLPGDEHPLAVLAAVDASAPERLVEGSQHSAAILAHLLTSFRISFCCNCQNEKPPPHCPFSIF